MESQPKVSVIVPVYNDKSHIDALLRSLLEQDFEEYEIIAVDDRSTDGSWERLETYTDDPRLRALRSPVNGGSGKCRNIGASQARGDIIAFIDSDCEAKPDWLAKLVTPIIKGEADASTGPNYLCLRESKNCRLEAVRAKQYWGFDTKNAAVSKDAFHALGGFVEEVRLNVDWEFHTKLQRAGCRVARTEAIVMHDYPDDPVDEILKARKRGREESKIWPMHLPQVGSGILASTVGRMVSKSRRVRNVWSEGSSLWESLAMVVYYIAFHTIWTTSLTISVLLSRRRPIDGPRNRP